MIKITMLLFKTNCKIWFICTDTNFYLTFLCSFCEAMMFKLLSMEQIAFNTKTHCNFQLIEIPNTYSVK